MNYQDCKNRYDIMTRNLQNKREELKEKESNFNMARDDFDAASLIYVSTKKEVEKSQENLDCYVEKKFNNIGMKLICLLGVLSICGEIILFFSGNNGVALALLGAPVVAFIDCIVYASYHLIRLAKPEWIERFWKNDKKLKQLEEIVKNKEKELVIAETNKNNTYDLSISCFRSIRNIEKHITHIEEDIKNLILSYATTLFEVDVNKQNNEETKPFTRIRRPENDKTREK